MWNLKYIENTDYFIDVEVLEPEKSLKILFSNLYSLWISENSKNDIIGICNVLNPLVEADYDCLLSEVLKLLDVKNGNVVWKVSVDTNTLTLNLNSTFESIPFKFDIKFQKLNEKEYFMKIVMPLLVTIKKLESEKEYLCQLLKKKDLEITEYKLEGAVLSRKTVETPGFSSDCLEKVSNESLKTILSSEPKKLFNDSIRLHCKEVDEFIRNKNLVNTVYENVTSNHNTENENKPKVATNFSRCYKIHTEIPLIGNKPKPKKLKNL